MTRAEVRNATASPRDFQGGVWSEVRGVYTIWLRDLVRFVNERARIVGALGQPLIYLFVLGTGVGATFRAVAAPEGFNYMIFMYPGVIGMTVLFTALFSAVSVIWDREFGFLKEILVAPISRGSIIIGKALGGASVAVLQGAVLLLLAPVVGLAIQPAQILQLLMVMLIAAVALTSFGLAVASRVSSMEGFQMVMNFLIIPMWLLSGAFFPLDGVPVWMRTLMQVNPLTYAVDALRGIMYAGDPAAVQLVAHSLGFNLTVVGAAAAVAFALAFLTFQTREG